MNACWWSPCFFSQRFRWPAALVQLSGFADSQTEIERAAQIAGKVPGVRSARNDLRLKPAGK